MAITSNTQVGEVVKLNFKTAPIFKANNIDYCCGGNKTILEACNEKGIESVQIMKQLEEIISDSDQETEFVNQLTLAALCDYIVKRHHAYVKRNIPFLKESLQRICEVHGSKHPELFKINKLFNETAGDMTMHMQKEEIMLFPYIHRMENGRNPGKPSNKPVFGSVANPIAMMISEHDTEGNRFKSIAELSGNYSVPEDACTTYRVTLKTLKDYEADLHRHIHLENNILFPKALKLEAEFEQ